MSPPWLRSLITYLLCAQDAQNYRRVVSGSELYPIQSYGGGLPAIYPPAGMFHSIPSWLTRNQGFSYKRFPFVLESLVTQIFPSHLCKSLINANHIRMYRLQSRSTWEVKRRPFMLIWSCPGLYGHSFTPFQPVPFQFYHHPNLTSWGNMYGKASTAWRRMRIISLCILDRSIQKSPINYMNYCRCNSIFHLAMVGFQ